MGISRAGWRMNLARGSKGIQLFRREAGAEVEFVTVMRFELLTRVWSELARLPGYKGLVLWYPGC